MRLRIGRQIDAGRKLIVWDGIARATGVVSLGKAWSDCPNVP